MSQGNDEFEIIGKSFENPYEALDYETGIYYTNWKNISDKCFRITWNDIFKDIAPEIFSPCKEDVYKRCINKFFENKFKLECFEISKEHYFLIKYQMIALDWICIDDTNMIHLTESGRKEFMNIITLKK